MKIRLCANTLSSSKETNMFLLWDTANLTDISYLQYNLKLWSCAYQTRITTSSFAWFNT